MTGGYGAAYNITSVTDVGTGKAGITWTRAFAGTDLQDLVTGVQFDQSAAGDTLIVQIRNTNLSASYVELWCIRLSDFTPKDPNYMHIQTSGTPG